MYCLHSIYNLICISGRRFNQERQNKSFKHIFKPLRLFNICFCVGIKDWSSNILRNLNKNSSLNAVILIKIKIKNVFCFLCISFLSVFFHRHVRPHSTPQLLAVSKSTEYGTSWPSYRQNHVAPKSENPNPDSPLWSQKLFFFFLFHSPVPYPPQISFHFLRLVCTLGSSLKAPDT